MVSNRLGIWLILTLVAITFLSIPVFILLKLAYSFYKFKNKTLYKIIKVINKGYVEAIYTMLVVGICIIGFVLIFDGVKAGEPLSMYEQSREYINGYASLSIDHIPTVLIFFTLGLFAYILLKSYSEKLSPVIYTVCCSLLILNILFTASYYYHTNVNFHETSSSVGFEVWYLRLGFIYLSLLYIAELKNSLDKFIKKQKAYKRDYKNKFLNILYGISIRYQTMPFLWIVFLFPVLIIVQLILVIFGQQPDSFIKVFLDTSSFNYSRVPSPPPIIVPGDSHYLCTVSIKGHKKLVKPLRAGIRDGRRILVNRQLLVANAFENILEQYVPKLHKLIRNIYDRYGYPLSKHINSSWSADLVYIFMKPLEWFFLFILYTVNQNPENRINIQYSELRKRR